MPNQEIPTPTPNGTTTVFTTLSPISNETIWVDKIFQIAGIDYTIFNNQITFQPGSIPQSGNTIRISYAATPTASPTSSSIVPSAKYDTDWFLEEIRARASLPPAKATGTDDFSIIRRMNDELMFGMQALLQVVRQEYLVMPVDQALVAGQSTYPIHTRARSVKLRDIGTVDSTGKFTALKAMRIDELDQLQTNPGNPYAFYFQDTDVVIYPTPAASGTLRTPIYRRPSYVVTTAQVATILSINVGAKQVTLSASPSAFTNAALYDLRKGTPHWKVYAIDQGATISGNVMTFTNTLPAALAVGDYVSLAGETAVPDLPLEMMPLLAQRTADTLRKNLNMPVSDAAASMQSAVTELLSPRIDGEVETYADLTFFRGVA